MWIEASGARSFRRQSLRDRLRDERGALFLQPFDKRALLRYQRIQPPRFAVEVVSNSMLLSNWRERYRLLPK